MAFSYLASVLLTGQTGGTTSAIDTTGATLLVASVSQYAGVGSVTVGTIGDSKSNSWVPLTFRDAGDAGHRFFYVANPTVGPGHTFALAVPSIYCVATFFAFGGAAAAPFDVETGTTTTAAGPLATGTVTPAGHGALLVSGWAGMNNTSNPTIGSGFTQTTSQNPVINVCVAGGAGYLIQSSAAAINPTWAWTGTDHVAEAVAVFLPAAAPAVVDTVQPYLWMPV